MDTLAITLRFGNYAILALIAGVPLFLWLALGRARGAQMFARLRGPYAILLIVGAALALLGLLAATATMAGTPLLPVDWTMVTLVLSATAAGKAIVLRAVLLILLLPLALATMFRTTAGIAATAAMTLAWSGHAAASEGIMGALHMASDFVHILAAALWIGGMGCLLLALVRPGKGTTLPMLHSFAVIGSIIVALLILTGLFNSLMILGINALPQALQTTYGKLLALKLVAFLAMLCLAANNRFRLTPAYEIGKENAGATMLRSIGIEILLGFFILALVSWLGIIDPMAAA